MRPGSLDDVAGLAEDLAALAPPASWFVERPSGVHAHAFAQPGDEPDRVRVVFLVHPGDRRVQAQLIVPTGTTLRDPLDGARFGDDAGVVAVPIGPRDARMLIVDQ